jgi:hypothetical protein
LIVSLAAVVVVDAVRACAEFVTSTAPTSEGDVNKNDEDASFTMTFPSEGVETGDLEVVDAVTIPMESVSDIIMERVE